MIKTLKIRGFSDDVISVEGDAHEEFYAFHNDNTIITISDGTVLSVEYTSSGIWRINRLFAGKASYSKVEGTDPDGDNYSDEVTIIGDIEWISGANQLILIK